MSDNVTANPGVGGQVFATEDLGGVQLPLSKPSYGAHGVSTPVSLTNGLPVQPQTGSVFPTSQGLLSAPRLTPQVIDTAVSQTVTIGSALSGQTVRLHRIILFVANPTNIKFMDGSTELCGPMPLLQSGSIVLDFSGDPWFTSSAGNALTITSSNLTQLSGTAYYAQS